MDNSQEEMAKLKRTIQRDNEIIDLLCKWTFSNDKGYCMRDFFHNNDFNNVAIYGAGKLGSLLYEILSRDDICVEYFIDRNSSKWTHEKKPAILSPEEDYPNVDVFVITVISEYEKIFEALSKKTNKPILFLDDIIG